MYYGRKKAIIIAVVIIILVIGLAAGGFYVYIATDLLKPNETLFFKYMGKALEDLKYVENKQMSEIATLKQEMPYELEANISSEVESDDNSINTSMLEKLKVGVEAKVDKPEEKAYTKVRLSQDTEDLFSFEYANSNQIYALKSDEIVTAFLGIENDNLKVLAQKMGLSDNANIPNTIKPIEISQILSITEEEKQYIRETYLSVLMENIANEKFTKEKNLAISRNEVIYNTTAYRLSLNGEELKQLEIALMQTLKEDSITLNLLATKAKLLGLEENYTQVNRLTSEIQKQINTIENEERSVDEGISIMFYVEKGNVITTEIILKNEVKYTIYGATNETTSNRYVLIENLNATEEYSKIEIQEKETRSNLESTYEILVNIDNEKGINILVTNTGSASEENVTTTAEVTLSQEETNWTIHYEQEINFQEEVEGIIELSRNNCGVLNDYTTEQLQALLQAITQRTVEVINEKVKIIMGENRLENLMQRASEARQELEEQSKNEEEALRQAMNQIDSML